LPEQAATDLLEYIKKFVPEPKRALLAGNSVHADKAFLRRGPYKKVNDHLSYRILDVSTLKVSHFILFCLLIDSPEPGGFLGAALLVQLCC
jgi:hypothetical protein